jgi:hypothetical protein
VLLTRLVIVFFPLLLKIYHYDLEGILIAISTANVEERHIRIIGFIYAGCKNDIRVE